MSRKRSQDLANIVRTWQHLAEAAPGEADLAEEFHEASKFVAASFGRQVRGQRLARDPVLTANAAEGARRLEHLPAVALAPVETSAVAREIVREPSCRAFANDGVALAELGNLLWYSYGMHGTAAPGEKRRRPIASAGGLYPLEVYVIADLGIGHKGLYHYDVPRHALSQVRDEIATADLEGLGYQQDLLTSAPIIILINGLFYRTRFKYGLRGYRFSLIEAGALIHQIQLTAQALGLTSLPMAGLYDAAVEELCFIDGVDEAFINAILVGHGQEGTP